MMKNCLEKLNKLTLFELESCKLSLPFSYSINSPAPPFLKQLQQIEENEEKEKEGKEKEDDEEDEGNYSDTSEDSIENKIEKKNNKREYKEIINSKDDNENNDNNNKDNNTSNKDNNNNNINTKIYVVNMDCFEVSAFLSMYNSDETDRPLVLNMANSYNCGGGFCGPSGSQEEYLFRNSSLVASLWPHRRRNDERWDEGKQLFPTREEPIYYPFTDCGGVYSPHVIVFNFPHICSVISIAAQDLRPGRFYNNSNIHFDYELAKQNLRSLFSIAAEYQHTTLVLGAIGCGAFRNPPNEVARAFSELLQNEFKNVFKYVIFAIIKSTENLDAFERVFGRSVDLQSVL